MTRFTVGLVQLAPRGNDQAANLAIAEAACRQAAAQGAHLALFPEMWNIGYTAYPGCPNDLSEMGAEREAQRLAREAWQAQAIGPESGYLRHLSSLARELRLALAVTYLERWPGAPRNTCSLLDSSGTLVLTYAKVHTCDFSLEAACTPGDAFPVAEVRTAAGPVALGVMICYDREFPESARLLMLGGAEIVLVPNATTMDLNRMSQLRARAYENMVGIALANYPGAPHGGHSVAFDGIAYDADGARDMQLVEAGAAEGIYLATFDLDALRDYRAREAWGDAFRRPHRYAALTETAVRPPFVRHRASGERYDRSAR